MINKKNPKVNEIKVLPNFVDIIIPFDDLIFYQIIKLINQHFFV